VALARSSRVALLALALTTPALAAAEPVAPSTARVEGAAPASRTRAVRLTGSFGIDRGFTKLLEVEMTDGSTQSLSANQGMFASVGATFLPLLDGRLETQATIGVKYWEIQASNAEASYLAFPVEVLELFHVAPLRFAAGLTYLHRPATSGDGLLSEFEIEFDSSLGVVLGADWTWRAKAGAPLLAIGPRLIWQRLQIRGDGPVLDANALGIIFSFTGA
jgi:hypothetical protein